MIETASKMTRFKRAIIIASTLLAFTVGIAFVWSTISAERRKNAMRAKGYPTTLTELDTWYEQPPEGENAAAFVITAGEQFRSSAFAERDRLPFVRPTLWGVNDNEVSADDLSRTAAFLSHHQEAYDLLAEAAQLEGSHYPLQSRRTTRDGINNSQAVVGAWRALRMKLSYHFANMNRSEAVTTFEQLARIVCVFNHDPTMRSVQARTPILEGTVSAAEYMMNTMVLSRNDFDVMDTALASLVDNNNILHMAIGELCMVEAEIDHVTGESRALAAVRRDSIMKVLDEFIHLVDRPLHEALPDLIEIDSPIKQRPFMYKTLALRALTRGVPVRNDGFMAFVTLRHYESNARVAAARGAILVEMARIDGNPLPQRLEDLPAEYRQHWPTDPFTNRAVLYRPTDQGYVTYSVGLNSRDDGGAYQAADEEVHAGPDIAINILQ